MDSQKIALVTGANRGIGLEICRQLAQQDYQVILTSRSEEKGQTAAQQLAEEGLTVDTYPLEVTDPDNVSQLKTYVIEQYGRLDVLVNNAGVYLDESERITDIDHAILHQSFDTNVYGPFYLMQAFVPLMQQHDYGRIVNMSSGYGALKALDSPTVGAYKLSKVTLNALTRLMASAVDSDKIKINSADPGWVRTDMGGSNASRSVAEGADTPVWLATLPDNGPSGGFFYSRKRREW